MHNEHDLDELIKEKLQNCSTFPNICNLLKTKEGVARVHARVKEIIFNDGITDIDAALAHIESELIFS